MTLLDHAVRPEALVLYGFPVSPNVRAVRVAFVEKKLALDFVEIGFDQLATPAYGALNPFRKMPLLRHQGRVLYETTALLTYADAIGSGPSLLPTEPLERAETFKFLGVAHNYLYSRGVMELFFHRVLAPLFGVEPSDAIALAAAEATAVHLDALESALSGGYLAGTALSLADLYCGAMVDYVAMTDEGQRLLGERPRLTAWLSGLRRRPSFASTLAPMLASHAAR